MNTKRIDNLNIVLIIASLFLAIILPFELFLFSYAILGPLHYLTEINWLNNKSFFIKNANWIWVFIVLTFLISLPVVLEFSIFNSFRGTELGTLINQNLEEGTNVFILVAFLFAIGILHLEKRTNIFLFLIFSIIISVLVLNYVSFSTIIIGAFLPTIIHVYVFTLLFMLFGTLNNRTNSGILVIVLLVFSPLLIFVLNIDTTGYVLSETTKANFDATGFSSLSVIIAEMLGYGREQFDLLSRIGIKIQSFIAFCYTYHYLNWFSKTTVIGWYKTITKPKLYGIIIFWITSVLLYWYNYKTGLMVLFFLSFLHVLLEFPLNIVSIKGIYKKIRNEKSEMATTNSGLEKVS